MLRSWTERLSVYLHPNRIVLVRKAIFPKCRITAKQVIAVEPSNEEPMWNPAISALRKCLGQPEWQGLRTTVILSGQFLRYRIALWDDRLTQIEREALVRHRFEEIYGQMRAWRILLADGEFRKHGLACAVDATLVDTLEQVFKTSTQRLISVKPYFVTALNHLRKKIINMAWLVFAEEGQVHLAYIKDGAWQSIRSKPTTIGWEKELELLLERESMQVGVQLAGSRIYFFWPDNPRFKPHIPTTEVQVLAFDSKPGFSTYGDASVAAAICV